MITVSLLLLLLDERRTRPCRLECQSLFSISPSLALALSLFLYIQLSTTSLVDLPIVIPFIVSNGFNSDLNGKCQRGNTLAAFGYGPSVRPWR